jgi:hypothetical protein
MHKSIKFEREYENEIDKIRDDTKILNKVV